MTLILKTADFKQFLSTHSAENKYTKYQILLVFFLEFSESIFAFANDRMQVLQGGYCCPWHLSVLLQVCSQSLPGVPSYF